MSSASDISAFEHSIEPAPAETPFRDKKWTYIQDSTSNTGQYAGQIQFNLSTISSQAAFVNWEEARHRASTAERSLFTALDQQSSKLTFDVMGGSANLQAVSKPQVYVAPAGAVAAGSPFYVAHYLACIKLRDIFDYFKKCPMQKNTRVLWNLSSGATITALAGGLALPASALTLTITADVNGTPTVAPGASFTWTVSNGIANPKRLIMQPVITNPIAGATVSDTINPFRSPFSTVPATTSPFAALKNLQTTVGNVPIWNNPVSLGYDKRCQSQVLMVVLMMLPRLVCYLSVSGNRCIDLLLLISVVVFLVKMVPVRVLSCLELPTATTLSPFITTYCVKL
ncbi:unnamed protein product [Phytophthora lilii]|uniref:Unnamed protein product n=1 Tax=Phytophthora lilii TaxID=2077276 RepID=A0A9W6XCC7_9STRA|nr:unnamed protein product [Phytophthora lilii]